MKKKIVFFDGDGTIWYPKKTESKKYPGWIYNDPRIKNHERHLILVPSLLSTLKKLKRKGITTVVLSASPRLPKEADALLKRKIKHFKLEELFDEVYATRDYHGSKGEFMLKILKRLKIPKSKALMVGDSYGWDYKPAKERGIDALLIRAEYEPIKHNVRRTIKKINEVLKYVV